MSNIEQFDIYLDDYDEIKKIIASMAISMKKCDVFEVFHYEVPSYRHWHIAAPRDFVERWAKGLLHVSDTFLNDLGETLLAAIKLEYGSIDIRRAAYGKGAS